MPASLSSDGRLTAATLALALLIASAGCKPKSTAAASAPAAAKTETTADAAYALTGTIMAVNRERDTLLVDHDDIPGLMPRMTMEFKVAPGDLAVAREGLRIRAKLYQSADGFHLMQVWPADAINETVVNEAQRTLRQDTVSRGTGAYREVGERLPDFALYDQTGAVAQSSRFRGKQIALNFIFTRCPDPNMCPASTMKMMQLQTLAREAGVENFELISITLDPEFDTPGALRDYADARGIDTSNFSFLTGPEGAIKDLLRQLGVLTFQEGPLLRHTLATVLIDETGKIIHRIDGSTWQASDFAARLRRPANAKAKAAGS